MIAFNYNFLIKFKPSTFVSLGYQKDGCTIFFMKSLFGFKIFKLKSSVNVKINMPGCVYISCSSNFDKHLCMAYFKMLGREFFGLGFEYSKVLEARGLGFNVDVSENYLILDTGFSHIVKVHPKTGVRFFKIGGFRSKIFQVFSLNFFTLGQISYRVKCVKKPSIYRESGIYFKDEIVLTKSGKKKKD